MRIIFCLVIVLYSLCSSAQDNLIGKWKAAAILLRNHEISLERKEKYIFKKDSTYIHRFEQYVSKGDTAREVLFSTTFFNGKRSTVVKDSHGNVIKPKRMKERGKFRVDKGASDILFITRDRSYYKAYDLDNKWLFLEETTEGVSNSEETVYLLKLKRPAKIFSREWFHDTFG